MTTRRPLIAANWKMNGDLALLDSLISSIQATECANSVDVLVCPPATLFAAFEQFSNHSVSLGSQNVSQFDSGAYTGEISAQMLKSASCEYVLIGHSERREIYSETNEIVAEKFVETAGLGLKPVLCIGESLDQREAGLTQEVLAEQLLSVLAITDASDWEDAVVAYEPIWAIGTGVTATSEMAQETHKFVREYLQDNPVTASIAEQLRILYGGSMKPENASDLLSQNDIDGGLIGGASLKPDSFVSILQAAC